MRRPNVLGSLNASLHALMEADRRVVLMGEDLLDPYGGAFKVSAGLSTAFPDRVLTSPISELGFTGVAVGMALRGLRPIVEIMFGDFLMLAADQLLNHATKYPWMYDGKATVPLVVRAPMGGRRGYGPTHSQSIEKHFLGMPGLVVVAPSPFHDPGALLAASVEDDRPVLFVENKLMYARLLRGAGDASMADVTVRSTEGAFPTVSLSYDGFEEGELTIVAYGGMAELGLAAAERLLIDHEIVAEVVLPSCLNPLDLAPIARSVRRTGRLLVCEEGTGVAGWGSEVVARAAEECFDALVAPPVRVTARDFPIGNTRVLEDAVLPQEDDVVRAARSVVESRKMRVVGG